MKTIHQAVKLRLLGIRQRAETIRDKALVLMTPIKTEQAYRKALWNLCAIQGQPSIGNRDRKKFDRLLMRIEIYEGRYISDFGGSQ
jgi:hypothetical protein